MAHTTAETAAPTAAEPVARKRSFAPLVIAALIALIGFAVIGTSTSGGAGNYNYSIAQLTKEIDTVSGKSIKVAGTIAKGSVRGQPASDSFRFDLTDDEGNKVAVAYKRLLPDPFEEGRDAIVSGKVVNGVLQATNLTVKCPSRYEDSEQLTAEQTKKYLGSDPSKHAEMFEKDQGSAAK